MGLPEINITFTERASAVVERSERGKLLLILRDTAIPATNPAEITDIIDIPSGINAVNKNCIEQALIGGETAPNVIFAYFIGEEESVATHALPWAESTHIDWLAIPDLGDDTATSVATWVKSRNSSGSDFIMAVLPNCPADDENIVNFTSSVTVGNVTYTPEQFCARIAGLICGTPANGSITYATIPEATGCTTLTKEAMNAAINGGQLIVFWDGEKVKIARGVNSLTTMTDNKGKQFKKIKLVETINRIKYDLTKTIEDNYIGKYVNTYDNRSVLLVAIQDYFDILVNEGEVSTYTAGFDINAIKAAMKEAGIKYSGMTTQQIMEYDFGTTAYFSISCRLLDAIEDVFITIAI